MYEFHIEKMSCGGCANRITRAIQAIDQGAPVEFDLPTKVIRVRSGVDEARLQSALSQAGYPAVPVAASQMS